MIATLRTKLETSAGFVKHYRSKIIISIAGVVTAEQKGRRKRMLPKNGTSQS